MMGVQAKKTDGLPMGAICCNEIEKYNDIHYSHGEGRVTCSKKTVIHFNSNFLVIQKSENSHITTLKIFPILSDIALIPLIL